MQAEDARALVDMASMRLSYMQLYASSKDLIVDYSTRSQNHNALLAALKEVMNGKFFAEFEHTITLPFFWYSCVFLAQLDHPESGKSAGWKGEVKSDR